MKYLYTSTESVKPFCSQVSVLLQNGTRGKLHKASVNAYEKFFPSNWLIYHKIMKTTVREQFTPAFLFSFLKYLVLNLICRFTIKIVCFKCRKIFSVDFYIDHLSSTHGYCNSFPFTQSVFGKRFRNDETRHSKDGILNFSDFPSILCVDYKI